MRQKTEPRFKLDQFSIHKALGKRHHRIFSFQCKDTNELEFKPAIYGLYDFDKCLYIGKSKSLANRIYEYMHCGIHNYYLGITLDHIEEVGLLYTYFESELIARQKEREAIKKLKPIFNVLS